MSAEKHKVGETGDKEPVGLVDGVNSLEEGRPRKRLVEEKRVV